MHDPTWQPRVIRRFIRSIASSTKVVRVETDAGEGFLKAMGNPEGPHCLACELVGTLLAEWLGLPTLVHALVPVAAEDELPLAPGALASAGPAFITRFQNGYSWGAGQVPIHRVRHKEHISTLVVFDTWVRNCDRYRPPPNLRVNRDNVFLSQTDRAGELDILAIDHTHAFTCGRELTRRLANIDEIQDPTVYGCFPQFQSFLRRDSVEAAASRLAQMDTPQAAAFVGEVPAQWQVQSDVRDAWIRFIVQRAAFVAENVSSWLLG